MGPKKSLTPRYMANICPKPPKIKLSFFLLFLLNHKIYAPSIHKWIIFKPANMGTQKKCIWTQRLPPFRSDKAIPFQLCQFFLPISLNVSFYFGPWNTTVKPKMKSYSQDSSSQDSSQVGTFKISVPSFKNFTTFNPRWIVQLTMIEKIWL